jgi:hypothetical protein
LDCQNTDFIMIVFISKKYSLLVLSAAIFAANIFTMANAADPNDSNATSFDAIAAVVMHPRCMNCHQTAAPRQNDSQILHQQEIVRGADGHGVPTLQCSACHQTTNTGNGIVPGAPGWHLAPLSMNWEGLTKRQICMQMKDPARNGARRTGEKVIEHMRTDPVVLWAWEPGANRTTPPISHDEFVRRLEIWKNEGMPCPQ